jgi:hypothetical protein
MKLFLTNYQIKLTYLFLGIIVPRIWVGPNSTLTKPACKVRIASIYKLMLRSYLIQCGTLNNNHVIVYNIHIFVSVV